MSSAYNPHGPHVSLYNCRWCWPVLDKAQETQFRKAAGAWIAAIEKVHQSDECLVRLIHSAATRTTTCR